jgi:hypothetical protein
MPMCYTSVHELREANYIAPHAQISPEEIAQVDSPDRHQAPLSDQSRVTDTSACDSGAIKLRGFFCKINRPLFSPGAFGSTPARRPSEVCAGTAIDSC